jgi:hypothetical protein
MHGRYEKCLQYFDWKTWRKELFGRTRHWWEDHVILDLRDIGREVVEYMHLTQDRDQWRDLVITVLSLLLFLAPQSSLGLGLLHKIRLNFFEASQQFSFLHGRFVSPTFNPHPGGPGFCIYIPQRQGLGLHKRR